MKMPKLFADAIPLFPETPHFSHQHPLMRDIRPLNQFDHVVKGSRMLIVYISCVDVLTQTQNEGADVG
jgi:hypothetical protein